MTFVLCIILLHFVQNVWIFVSFSCSFVSRISFRTTWLTFPPTGIPLCSIPPHRRRVIRTGWAQRVCCSAWWMETQCIWRGVVRKSERGDWELDWYLSWRCSESSILFSCSLYHSTFFLLIVYSFMHSYITSPFYTRCICAPAKHPFVITITRRFLYLFRMPPPLLLVFGLGFVYSIFPFSPSPKYRTHWPILSTPLPSSNSSNSLCWHYAMTPSHHSTCS